MDYHGTYKKVESFVTELFEKNQTEKLLFHNLAHTEAVVQRTKEIALQYEISERDQFVLYTAAWFHDTGHLFVDPSKHEIKSVELMKDFLQKYTADEPLMREIGDCILATRMPRNPQNVLQQIICDADTYHLGTKDFKMTNKQLRKEYELRNVPPPVAGWRKNSLDFMESHEYYTEYCRNLLDEGKRENIEKLRKKIGESKEGAASESTQTIFGEMTMKDKKEGARKNTLLTRGIQTMLRLTSDNSLELSGLADGKANILISVNAIIISVILTVLLRRLEIDTHLTIPTIIFLGFSVATIVIAIMATRPKVSTGVFSREDIMNKKTNLLFFGNFHKASLEEYEWGMSQMMKDQDYLYGALIKDIHQLGVVLGRKYRLIRLAYNVFMIGIIVSVIAFTLAVLLNNARGGVPNSDTMPI
ncbi:MAG TPA: Pycsar system effector family protein [Chitinophagaceae bacterium]|nr:Pycsar system effector family protein [Chitinophagaceae bacterium]